MRKKNIIKINRAILTTKIKITILLEKYRYRITNKNFIESVFFLCLSFFIKDFARKKFPQKT